MTVVRFLAIAVAFIATGCNAPGPMPGLRAVGNGALPMTVSGTPHATELLVREGVAYVANSFDGVAAFRVAPGVTPELAHHSRAAGEPVPPRCTTIAFHEASATIFCAAADRAGLASFASSAPERLALRANAQGSRPEPGYRDLYCTGDALYLAGFDRGLLRASVGPDGAPGEIVSAVPGRVVGVDGDDDHVATLDRDRGLVSYRAGLNALVELGAIALDGPLIDLTVHDGRAAVAMGSQGVALFDLTPAGPVLVTHVQPECVATGADFREDTLAISCTSGVYVYDMASRPARVTGFQPAQYTMLDVRLLGTTALVADWRALSAFDVDHRGAAVVTESSPGFVVREGDPASIELRNPGDLTLRVVVTLERSGCDGGCSEPSREVGRVTLAPFARGRVVAAASAVDAFINERGEVRVVVRVEENSRAGRDGAVRMTLLPRATGSLDGPPAIGDAFPTLTVAAGESVPAPGRASYAYFALPDCALQWPALEDLGWLARHGLTAGGAVPMLLVLTSARPLPWDGAPFLALWDAGDVTARPLVDYAASIPGWERAVGGSSEALFNARFFPMGIVGPDSDVGYHIDASGVVRDAERIYRGRWPLTPP